MGTHRPNPTLETNGIIWLAGEASGDYIASLALPEVEKRFEGSAQYGVGGPRMRAAGFHAWHDIRELSVRGYVEVLSHLPRLLRLRSELVKKFAASNPRVFVGVDAPDFNLGIEQQLRRRADDIQLLFVCLHKAPFLGLCPKPHQKPEVSGLPTFGARHARPLHSFILKSVTQTDSTRRGDSPS